MPIGFVGKLAMKRDNIARKIQRKFGDIFALPLAAQKFPPGDKQVFHGYDSMENMTNPPLTLSLSLSAMPRF